MLASEILFDYSDVCFQRIPACTVPFPLFAAASLPGRAGVIRALVDLTNSQISANFSNSFMHNLSEGGGQVTR